MKTLLFMKLTALFWVGATAAEFHPYPIGLMHQSSLAEAFPASDGLLKTDCESRCGTDCEGFLLIDGLCRQLIAAPFHGGLAHHGEPRGLFRIESVFVHQVFRKTTDPDFLSQEGIHDCRKDPCTPSNTLDNSCLVYGECVCKPNPLDPKRETFIGPTCANTASECRTVLEELVRSADCPCGTQLQTNAIDLSLEDETVNVCVSQTPSAALAPIITLSDCASKYAKTAKLERSNLISPVFRRMGAGTRCVPPIGQEPEEGNMYNAASPEVCAQFADGSAGYQFTPTADLDTKNCVVFNKVADVEYGSNAISACHLNFFFEYNDGSQVRVLTHEKTVDVTSRVTKCLVSQQVTTGIDSLQLALDRLNVIRTVARSFAYRVSDGILVMQDQRLQIRLEDQLRFMDLALQEDSDFFCKTLCPCGTYSVTPTDTTCTQQHRTFRSGLEHARAQMNCVFRKDWDSNNPLLVGVLLNSLTCAAFYRDKDDSFYLGVLAEGRARAALALSNAAGNDFLKHLPGTFVNNLNILFEGVSTPLSSKSFSISGSDGLIAKIESLEATTEAVFAILDEGPIFTSENGLNASFVEQAMRFDSDSLYILSVLMQEQSSLSSQPLETLLSAIQTLNSTAYGSLAFAKADFQTDLADFIERFPGVSPKFDKEVERSNAAFQVFQSLVELIPFLLSEAVRVGSRNSLVLREVAALSPGISDLDRFQQSIARFKFLSDQDPSLVPLVQRMTKFHNDWQALTWRNNGEILDLDSLTSYGRLRELILSIASTASHNAYVMIFMLRVLDTRHSDQDPVWTLSSSGVQLLEGFMLRFSSLFVHDFNICPQPTPVETNLTWTTALSQRVAAAKSGSQTKFRDALKSKSGGVLNSCARFHQVLGEVVTQASLALGAAFDFISTAQNELREAQDTATNSSLAYFLEQVESFPDAARNPLMALYFRDRFLQVQMRWARYMEKLCNVFKVSSADLIPGLGMGGSFSFDTSACQLSTNNALSKNVVPAMDLAWTIEENIEHGPLIAILNGDGTVTAFYNGTGRVGDMSTVDALLQNVIELRGNLGAYAALRADGRVIAWGNPFYGGDVSSIPELESGVERLFDTAKIDIGINERLAAGDTVTSVFFAAQKRDGSVVVWGGLEPYRVFNDVADITISHGALAILHVNRTVTSWGAVQCGGDASSVQHLLVDVEQVYLNLYVFQEGRNPFLDFLLPDDATSEEQASALVNFTCSFLEFTFWAHKKDGSVVAWGAGKLHGADTEEARALLSGGVTEVHPKPNAVLFMQADRSAFTIGPQETPTNYELLEGDTLVGSNFVPTGADSSSVADKLNNIRSVHLARGSFAVLRQDGSVVTWGANETQWGAGDSSSVSQFLSKDIVQITEAESSYCAVNKQSAIECWGKKVSTYYGQQIGEPAYEFDDVKNLLVDGVKLQRDGKFEVYGQSETFLARRRSDGQIVHWGYRKEYDPLGERVLTPMPDVAIKQVFFESKTVLMEDGTVVSFEPILSRRETFEAVQPRLTDIVEITSARLPFLIGDNFLTRQSDLHIAQAADGSLIAWGTSGKGDLFTGRSIGSEMESSNRLAAKVRVTENGLKGATGRWLRPAQSEQTELVQFQPACSITDPSKLASLLQQGDVQMLDVTVASFSRFCTGNVGVRSVEVKLFGLDGKELENTKTKMRFKLQVAPGALEFKYFARSTGGWVESASQRSATNSVDEYLVDQMAVDAAVVKATLAEEGNMLPSPYTKWLLSSETTWPEDVALPSSLSIAFTLSGGECLSGSTDVNLIKFSGERGFLNKDEIQSLFLTTTCGGSRILQVPTSSPTIAPTKSAAPTAAPTAVEQAQVDPSNQGSSPWVLPLAISGGVAVALASAALALVVLKRRKSQQLHDDVKEQVAVIPDL